MSAPSRAGDIAPAADHSPPTRRYELDWLRAAIVLGLIPFHAAVIFGATTAVGLKISGPSTAALQVMGGFAQFALLIGMPLLFFVAGASAWFALKPRAPHGFVRERLLRLLVPLVAGSLVLIPIQTYFVLLSNPGLLASNLLPGAPVDLSHISDFPHFYGQFLIAYGYFLTHYTLGNVILFWQHLWFLPRLLAYSLVAVPLMLYLKGPGGRRAIGQIARVCARPGGLLLLAVPLAASDVALNTGWLTRLTQSWPIYDDWQAFIFGLIIFVYGYMVYADGRFTAAVRRQALPLLLVGLGAGAVIVTALLLVKAPPAGYSLAMVGFLLLRALAVWALVIGIAGMAMHYLTFTNRTLRYLNEATFPVYLIHMTLLTLIAFYLERLPLAWGLQFTLIMLATLAATFAVYEMLIKRFVPVRWLFGMRASLKGERGHAREAAGE
jgi:peptidoglycan/LPS O-acetylase OafA/YrhL